MKKPAWNRPKSRVMLGLLLFLAAAFLSQCGVLIGHASFSGQVVDAESGHPVSGAVVVAVWELQGLHSTVGVFEFQEVVADSDGNYTVPRWGPRLNLRFLFTSMYHASPRLVVFKSDYQPEFRLNHRKSWGNPIYYKADSLENLTISLQPVDSLSSGYGDLVSEIDSTIRDLLTRAGCDWEHIPNLLIEMDKTGRKLINAGIDARNLLITRIPQKNCGNPAEVLRQHGNREAEAYDTEIEGR